MSKEKQIEEMWNIITTDCNRECDGCEFENDEWCFTHRVVKELYNAGYRKQSEGEWGDCYPTTTKSHKFVCSACKAIAYYPQPTRTKNVPRACKYNFCPNCGAKMRKEDEGE